MYPIEVDLWEDKQYEATSNGLLLMGPVGTGKTHLAVAVMRAIQAGVLISAIELLQEILESYRTHAGCPRLELARDTELLVLDDLGAEASGDWATREIFELIGYRYEMALPLIVTTNCTLASLGKRLGPRTVSRLSEMCEVVQLSGPDYRIKKAKR
jgi:DNA replication protein DnaC